MTVDEARKELATPFGRPRTCVEFFRGYRSWQWRAVTHERVQKRNPWVYAAQVNFHRAILRALAEDGKPMRQLRAAIEGKKFARKAPLPKTRPAADQKFMKLYQEFRALCGDRPVSLGLFRIVCPPKP